MKHIVHSELLALGVTASVPGTRDDQCTGYPVGNFGIAGEVTPAGRGFSRVLYNPPVLGPWLEELGRGRFVFAVDGTSLRDDEFESVEVDREYPNASAVYTDKRIPGFEVRSRFFAPIRVNDTLAASIPALCVELEFVNSSESARRVRAAFEFVAVTDRHSLSMINAGGFWLVGDKDLSIGFDRSITWGEIDGGISVSSVVDVPAGGSKKLRFLLVCYHPDGFYSGECADLPSLVCWTSHNWPSYHEWRRELVDMLPRTHDDRINCYLGWYLQAAVLLTRVTREHVLTMGYCELNQRDSYWTSWPHLVLWPELERRMILESASFQREDGKIPTTILPTTEREDDIDINEYFNLRAARYFEWTGDVDFLRELWPSLKRSINYLVSRDTDGDGMPDQGSFWADWKDVKGVEGRKAAPHFEFLWLAVLKYAQEFANMLGDNASAKEYSALYNRACDIVHADVRQGGLWNGAFYTTQWWDGRQDNHVQQDQCVGPLFGVVPADRIASIYRALEPSMTPWGVRDTYPYRENFNNVGGDYHNGGVWVFLNFVDALSRFVTGYPSSAWEILTRVAEWDLEKWGDYMPAEYLDGNTGENAGKQIQGWDSCFFAAVLFGALGVKIVDSQTIEIIPRIELSHSYQTPILTPHGVIRLEQTGEPNTARIELRSEMDRDVTIRFGALNADGAETVTVGECVFALVELTLAAGESQTVVFTH